MVSQSRRSFLASAAAGAAAAVESLNGQTPPMAVIDTHIHLFDQTRPQGAPYVGNAGNTEPALPENYRKLKPFEIVGAIEIEASPWIEDNLWVLEVEATDSIMVGYIGNLQPEKPEFAEYLERYHRNQLFRGIRYGNIWGYSLANQVSNPVFIEGLKLLQDADLTLDTANPNPDLIEAVIRVTDLVPNLRVVIDHVPAMLRQLDMNARAAIDASLRELAKRPQVYIKVSSIMIVDAAGRPVTDPAVYKPNLDYLFQTFGEDKVIFGSDWPNSIAAVNLTTIVKIAQDYFLPKGFGVAEKYFWRNSIAAYKWIRREYAQPTL